jgi:hypothetical protein
MAASIAFMSILENEGIRDQETGNRGEGVGQSADLTAVLGVYICAVE